MARLISSLLRLAILTTCLSPSAPQPQTTEPPAYRARLGLLCRFHSQGQVELSEEWLRIAAAGLMAFRHYNENITTIVPRGRQRSNMSVAYELWDTSSLPSEGVRGAVRWTGSGFDAVIGAPRSAVSVPVSLVMQMDMTPTVSYWSTAGTLSDKNLYPNFARVIPPDSVFGQGIAALAVEFEWRTLAMIYMDDSWGSGYALDIANWAQQYGILIESSTKFSSGNEESVQAAVGTLSEVHSNIFVCIAFSTDFPAIMLEADRLGIIGREGYVWITSDGTSGPDEVLGLSSNPALPKLLPGWITLASDPLFGDSERRFQAAWSAEEPFYENYTSAISQWRSSSPTQLMQPCSDLCAYIYDSVWTALVAIEETLGDQNSLDKLQVIDQLKEVSFQGASGQIALDENADRTTGVRIVIRNWVEDPSTTSGYNAVEIGDWEIDSDVGRYTGVVPTWMGGMKTWDVPKDRTSCGVGRVFSTETRQCEWCPPGTYQDGIGCTTCEVGTYAPAQGLTRCIKCPFGFANETGMAECYECPANTQRPLDSAGESIEECTCIVGYYSKEPLGPKGQSCVLCPAGAQCLGGNSTPFPLSGYWADNECREFGGDVDCMTWDMFLECNPRWFCKGGKQFQCAKGHRGRMCTLPDEDYYIIGGLFYEQCGKNGAVTTIFGILGVIVVWVGINTIASGNYDALDLALLFLQIIGMISTYGLNWHKNLEIINIMLGVANFDVDFVAPYCLGEWSEASSFALQLALPLLFGICWSLYYWCIHLYRIIFMRAKLGDLEHHVRELRSKLISKVFSLSIVVYHTLCLKCGRALFCKEFPDGNSYLKFAPEQQCYNPAHWAMIVVVILYIPCIIGGVPAWIYYIVSHYKKEGRLHDTEVMERWGFLYQRYESDWMTWEVMLVFRRLIIAFLSVGIDTSMLQAGITIVFLAFFLSVHVYARPYVNSSIDTLDFFSILGSAFFVLSGCLFYPSLSAQSQGTICTEDDRDDSRCKTDLFIKDNVSFAILFWTGVTVLVAGKFSYDFVLELNSSAMASQIVHEAVRGNQHSSVEGGDQESPQTRSEDGESLVDPEKTENKVVMDNLIQGKLLLNWAMSLSPGATESLLGTMTSKLASFRLKPPSVTRSHSDDQFLFDSASAFMDADRGVRSLTHDVTHFSGSELARIIRKLCEVPALIDWLGHGATEEDRASFQRAIHSLAEFSEQRKSKDHLPYASMLSEDYSAVLTLYLLECSPHRRLKLCHLLSAIMMANHIDVNDKMALLESAKLSSQTATPQAVATQKPTFTALVTSKDDQVEVADRVPQVSHAWGAPGDAVGVSRSPHRTPREQRAASGAAGPASSQELPGVVMADIQDIGGPEEQLSS